MRFIVSEREPVRVSRIVVRGANRTKESLIRSRTALEVGGLYQRSLVRKTEERLPRWASFRASASVSKIRTCRLAKRWSWSRSRSASRSTSMFAPGFSTGEGARISFEYGHRNLSGQAISLTLRSQLGYLPTAFILEDDVKQKYS